MNIDSPHTKSPVEDKPLIPTGKDVVVLGAGPVGLCAALTLRLKGYTVQVLERSLPDAVGQDSRAVGLSYGSKQILERLGVWSMVKSTAISAVHISQAGSIGRLRILAEDEGTPALGYVARLSDLSTALMAVAHQAGVVIQCGTKADTRSIPETTALLIRAVGTPNSREDDSQYDYQHDYGQTAIVFMAYPVDSDSASRTSREDHLKGSAWERLCPEGPLAILPFEGAYSITWCVSKATGDSLLGKSDEALMGALQESTRFTGLRWQGVGKRSHYPLECHVMQRKQIKYGDYRIPVIAIGNSAQTLHPIGAQGLNLGLRDAYELGVALPDGIHVEGLQHYLNERACDQAGMVRLTDKYARLFSSKRHSFSILGGLGLCLADNLPLLRSQFAQLMMFGVRGKGRMV